MKAIAWTFVFVALAVMGIGIYHVGNPNSWLTKYGLERAKRAAVQRVIDGREEKDDRELLDQAYPFAKRIRNIQGQPIIDSCDREELAADRARIEILIRKKEKAIETPYCVSSRLESARSDAARRAEEKRKKDAVEAEKRAKERAAKASFAAERRQIDAREVMIQRLLDGKETARDRRAMAGVVPDILELERLREKDCLTECERKRLMVEKLRVERFTYEGDTNFNVTVHPDVSPGEEGEDVDLSELPVCGSGEECHARASL